ncbi:hypothetical protein B7494_g7231 [Chlorociboria aeruginascens]|nr:hypothetical protein B7494_g7231 [Chlorociboria aeruginascens]
MVKHQRRSHQRGIHSSEPDDGDSSDSDSGESPSTPQHSGQIQWPQNSNVSTHSVTSHAHLSRSHSFADFGHQGLDGFPIQQSYVHRQNLSDSQPNFPSPLPEYVRAPPIIHRATSLQSLQSHSSYYIPEQNNPGVATLNTNPPPIQTYQIPRQHVDRSPREMVQSSPSSYSSVSRASPVSQEPFYTHHPVQTAPYAMQNPSPLEQQPVIHYPHHMPPNLGHPQQQQQQQPMPTTVSQTSHIQQYNPVAEQGHWYDQVAYQSPVEVINHIPSFPQAVFNDPWAQKLDTFDDPSLQMPSARIENL